MRRVALIYNPASGQHSARGASKIENVKAVLHKAGIETNSLETHAPGSGKALAVAAVRQGHDTVLACGGDGTVHEVLQCLVGTNVALGVVPLGTANALAQNLGLGRNPVKAIECPYQRESGGDPCRPHPFQGENGARGSRYFTVAAGIGADALLMSSMDPVLKRRYGYALYMLEASKIWAIPSRSRSLTHRFSGDENADQPAWSRSRNFLPSASDHLAERWASSPRALPCIKIDLSLVAFKTRSRLSAYLRFLLATLVGRQTFSRTIELLDADPLNAAS